MFKRVKGFRDTYGVEYHYNKGLISLLEEYAHRAGFTHVELPILEKYGLFARSAGEQSDIVSKEMFVFDNAPNPAKTDLVALRPEGTASAVRAYIENKFYTQQNRIDKLSYSGAMFRRERPQRGRYRQFSQFGVEVLATQEPYADAEIIAMAYDAITEYGLRSVEVCINSIGCKSCRSKYEDVLRSYFAPVKDTLCGDCQGRYEERPLRLLDCKVDARNPHTMDAPQITDYLCEACEGHFEGLKGWLDAMETPFRVDTKIVRGLDYYMRTAFEIVHTAKYNDGGGDGDGGNDNDNGGSAKTSVICGGGRYNGLVKELGGPDTEGVGFAIGVDRVAEALLEQDKYDMAQASAGADGVDADADETPVGVETSGMAHIIMDAYVATPLAPENRKEGQRAGINIMKGLRGAGLCAIMSATCTSLKSQLKVANRYNSRFTIIIGDKEIADNVVLVRDMGSGEQVLVPADFSINDASTNDASTNDASTDDASTDANVNADADLVEAVLGVVCIELDEHAEDGVHLADVDIDGIDIDDADIDGIDIDGIDIDGIDIDGIDIDDVDIDGTDADDTAK